MPATEAPEARRGRVLQGLFWSGVGLAPLAVLILLFGQGTGPLRVAVILAVLTVVLIAVSVVLRPTVDLVRVDIEERVLEDVEHVRVQLRQDITTAGRNTHRALSQKIQALTDTIDALRARIDELEANPVVIPAAAAAGSAAVPPAGPGVVRRTETVHVTRRTTIDEDRGTVYGSRAAVDGEWSERTGRTGREEGDRSERLDRTERVDRSDRSRRRPSDDLDPPDHRRGDRSADRWDDGRGDRWDGMAAGDRWASVRDDDHGREFRVGERRSSVQRDRRGSEFHVEDRWASLRRDGLRGDDDDLGDPDLEATFRALRSNERSGPAALPASPGESAVRYLDADGRERGRSDDRDRGYDGDRDREYDRDRGYDGDRDRAHERDRGRDRDRAYERDRGYDRDRDRDDDWERERGRSRDRGRDDPPYPRQRSPHPSDY